MNEKPSVKKRILTVLAGIAVTAAVLLLGAALYLNAVLGRIDRVTEQETLSPEQIQAILSETDPPEETVPAATEAFSAETEPAATEEPTEPPTEAPTEPPTEAETAPVITREPTIVNILLIGQDRRKDEPRQRSDAMILCTINSETKTIVLTSFLRDTYVKLPGGYGKNRLNVPYAIGGFEMLDECLEQNFGVHVDHNIEVDFTGFKQVIDAVGGIDMELTAGEAEIVEGDQVVGMNHLDGGQALMYARIRKLDSDFERTNRQRKVLSALYDKAKEMSLRQLLELMDAVLPMITTDMTDTEIIGYMSDLFPIWKELEIVTQSVPGKNEFYYDSIDGMSVVVPYWNKVRQKLAETIGS